MKERSRKNPDDPTGWTYQVMIHAKNCRHGGWWFLPWHRGYLYYFERILRDASGDDDLRVPYWDYADPGSRALPAQLLDSGSVLFDSTRSMNNGECLTIQNLDFVRLLQYRSYIGSGGVGLTGGFGGGRTGIKHGSGTLGELEMGIHNTVHSEVGGNMYCQESAANDPIFWLHHSNVDRMWEIWLAQGTDRHNPVDEAFLSCEFEFDNEFGRKETIMVRDLIDTRSLGYEYDNLEVPAIFKEILTIPQDHVEIYRDGTPIESENSSAKQLSLLLSRHQSPIVVRDSPQVIGLDSSAGYSNQVNLLRTLPIGNFRVVLRFSLLEFDKIPVGPFEVFLNQPTADHTTIADEVHYVGVISFFQKACTGFSGQRVFDITAQILKFLEDRKYDRGFTATIVPVSPMKNCEPTKPEGSNDFRVGQVQIDMILSSD